MDFYRVVDQAMDLLRQRGRVTYRALQRQFSLDDAFLEDLKAELIKAQHVAVDEHGEVLVWQDAAASAPPGQTEARHGEAFGLRVYGALQLVTQLLEHERRMTYATLMPLCGLDQALLEQVRDELLFKHVARDESGKGLVWTGEASPVSQSALMVVHPDATPAVPIQPQRATDEPVPVAPRLSETRTRGSTVLSGTTSPALRSAAPLIPHTDAQPEPVLPVPLAVSLNAPPTGVDRVAVFSGSALAPATLADDLPPERPAEPDAPLASVRHASEAGRRQLTVMFCDLVGSTDLSGRLDPEDLHEIVRAYQETAAEVIARYEGHIAQYLGDGLLIYFGFPVAHEDDAQRAVYTGLGIPEAMATLNTRLEADYRVRLAVRIGIHTGSVVVGAMGGGGRHENLALGDTPNIAARLEGLAQPNTAVISPVTAQLVQRTFVLEELGAHELKGVAEPMRLYRALRPREAGHDDHEATRAGGFDALVGRKEEIGLLRRRWEQSKAGLGQVVLLSGEAGIGKSSLVDGLRQQVHQEGSTRITFRCSEYVQQSPLSPVIDYVHRVLGWQREDDAATRLATLEQGLAQSSLPLADTVPLVAALLSLALPEGRYPALTLSPPQQRQQTQDVLVAWLLEQAERQPVLVVWEDLHWADPSTLELVGLLLDQVPTVAMLQVVVFRPTFVPPWPTQAHITSLTLNHLERPQVEAMITRLAGGKGLPPEVVTHIVAKTDGVPLYVEELTKMLLESALLQEEAAQYRLTGPLARAAIPATLQDALMARLDRLQTVKEVAQWGAVLGREFAYDMLQALAAVAEPTLQAGLRQLVDSALLYQRGRPPRATYTFRHALIRDTAYQSLLRRTRQQYHAQVAQLLEARFPEVVETQPEVVAHHYTEAGVAEPAVAYWQRAGQRALQRSAYAEAIAHLTHGLAVLTTRPETPARLYQELDLQVGLGSALIATKGQGAPDVARAYARARELCQQLGDTPQLFPVLRGLVAYYLMRGQVQEAHHLGEQLLRLAHAQPDQAPRMLAHYMLGAVLLGRGEQASAQTHHTQARALYTPQEHRALAVRYGIDVGVGSHSYLAWELWSLGSPDQALQQSRAARTLAQEVAHPWSLSFALFSVAAVHQFRREVPAAQELATALMTLATEQGFAQRLANATVLHGWALAQQGQGEAGIAAMRQGLAAELAPGLWQPYFLGLLAETYGASGHPAEGLTVLAEALAVMETTEVRWYAAEISRLKGALLLRQAVPDASQAEACFHQALAIARQQQAKSWELRAGLSLARLWQSQGKRQEAHDLLAPVYTWFTEGFDTADLQEAKVLLEELA